ncbi:golgin subfamily A member 5-like isoform X1 [Sinocyclocheilus grahami]|uniref:Golgin subfamily A member 5 n=1 Tax=Sinocyclocheilus grahami TaxID=75366 RepID=A0A672Q4M3_SINGR|nr:PREDICTED: golgin subfamily A member 5-like isoform X1 [Sinocyclocheilus grahami]
MSWFVDLAGKAEDFLNKVDQGAASALTTNTQKSSLSYNSPDTTDSIQYNSAAYSSTQQHRDSISSSSHGTSAFISTAAGNIKKSNATVLASTANVSSTTPLGSSSKASSNFVRPKKPEVNDDLLFDFLNSSDPLQSEIKEVRRETVSKVLGPTGGSAQTQMPPISVTGDLQMGPSVPATPSSTEGLSRNSSLGSLSNSSHSIKTEDGSTRDQSQADVQENLNPGLDAPTEAQPALEITPQELQQQQQQQQGQEQVISNLRLENQLLRSEVSSLNQEMASVIQRAKNMQEEMNLARARAEKWNSDQSRVDGAARELRAQVDDLTEALSAKDGQLAVLKVRLDEADQILKARSSALEEAQNERIRILQDHSEGSSLQSQALQTLQDRIRDAEAAVKREQESYRQIQSEFAARLAKVETERQQLAESLTNAERRVTEEKQRAEELLQQVKSARSTAEYTKQELQDYKNKASRILQSKEKLISSLKEGSGLEVLEGAGAGVELEELRHEKELQREETQKLQAQIQSLRTEIQDLETQALTETENWREQLAEVQEQHAQQIRAKQEIEAELERSKQELQYIEEEHHHTKTALHGRVKDREDEIQKLRNQLTNKALSNSGQAELEGRLHQLTETLIQKQTMLEALGTEKNSLVFQLERLGQQLKSLQGGQNSSSHINMAAMEGPGARQRSTPILFNDADGPGTGVYGKVREAASTIDRFSIRLGIFLRRYPMARVFVIIYMALLHLWVMIVLLTYTPEMHHNHPDGR